MNEFWMIMSDHAGQIATLVLFVGVIGFYLGRRAMAIKGKCAIRDLERQSARLELSAQEHQRAAADLYDRAERAEQTIHQLERSLIELPELAQRLCSVRDLREIPARALDLVQDIFGSSYAVFFRSRVTHLIVQATKGDAPYKVGQRVKPGEGIAGITAMKQLPIRSDDLRFETAQVRYKLLEGNSSNTNFSICIPVLAEHLTIGVILVGPTEREVPNARELGRTIALLTSVSMNSAAVLKQQKMLAKIDGLTTLLNRVHILRHVQDVVDMEGDAPRTLSLFLFDIDHFKHFNDTNGHLPGDDLLRSISALLKEQVRDGESVGRYGGEEFLMVMPDTDRNTALQAAERIRRLIEKENFQYGEKQPGGRLTVSGGVANYPADADDTETLLRHADEALYEAKRAGRNRVIAYSPPDIGTDDPYDPATGEFHSLLIEEVDKDEVDKDDTA